MQELSRRQQGGRREVISRMEEITAGELYAGRGGMLEEAVRLGYKPTVICEREPYLRKLLQHKFKGADVQPDMDTKPWIQWAARGLTVYLLIAGFACQPFSGAGKMREQNDPRAFQILLVIEAAIALKVTELLLENVLGFVDNDERHGIYTMAKAKLHVAGFRQHRGVKAKDSDVAGDTGRDRIFLKFKRMEGVDTGITRLHVAQWKPKSWPASVPLADRGDLPWGKATIFSGSRGRVGGPAGRITLREEVRGMEGQAIILRSSDRIWRVMHEGKRKLKLMDVNRRDPMQLTVDPTEVVGVDARQSTFSVIQPGDKIPTLTASGEPPRYGAPLILGKDGNAYTMGLYARALVHGVPAWEVQFLAEAGCSVRQVRAVLGGMVTTATTKAVFQELILPAKELIRTATALSRQTATQPATQVNVGASEPMAPPKKRATEELSALRKAALASMAGKGQSKWSGNLVEAGAQESGNVLVLLVPTSRQERTVQIGESTALGVIVPVQQLVTGKVAQLVQHLLPQHELALAGRCSVQGQDRRESTEVMVVIALSLAAELPLPITTLQQLEDSRMYTAAALAMARALSYGGGISRADMLPLLDSTGRTMGGAEPPGQAMSPPQELLANAARAQQEREVKIREAECHHTELRRQLLLLADKEKCIIRGENKSVYLREWTAQITSAAAYFEQAPDAAFLQPVTFADERLRLMPFIDLAPIANTKRLPPVPDQEPLPEGFDPQSLADLQMPGQAEQHAEKLGKHVDFLRSIQHTDLDRQQLAHARPKPSASSELRRVPEVRGRVMDLRGDKPKPLDLNAPVKCALDATYMRSVLPNHEDEQILQHIEEGVRSQTDLGLQTVLQSHLLSLANHTEDLNADIERRHKIQYLERYKSQPFDPIRLVPQGTVPKVGSIRQVSDLGQPHKEVLDDTAVPVRVYNVEATTNIDGSPKLPHEWKPLAPHVLQNMAVMRYVSDQIGLLLSLFSDDLKDFFRQLAQHPSELYKLCFLWINSSDDDEFIVENRLGFGLAHASNLAQRLTNAVIKIFHIEFQKVDAPYLEEDCQKHPLLRNWPQERAAVLGKEHARVYDVGFYTDDLFGMVLGEARYARAIGVWFEVTRKINLACSAPKKRLGGVVIPWTGIVYHSTLGGACLPEDKRINCQRVLAKAGAGTCPVSEYRPMVGLIEWARFALCISSLCMYMMYEPMRRGQELSRGPATLVKNTKQRIAQWKFWSNTLAVAAFAAATAVLGDRPMPPLSSAVHAWHGDAAIKGTKFPGLCGFWRGLYWVIPLSVWQLQHLHITALELLVVMINFAVFGPMLELLDSEQLQCMPILVQCDSLVSTKIITGKRRGTSVKSAAKSPIMQHIHHAMTQLPEYARLHEFVVAGHEWGEGNIFSDAGSRGREDKLVELCELLGMRAKKITLPPEVVQFVDNAAHFAAAKNSGHTPAQV